MWFSKVLHLLREILYQLRLLYKLLSTPTKLQITFEGEQPGMPASITDTQSISASISETDAAGQPVTIDPTQVAWSVGDPSIAELTQNADGSASFKALAVGQTQVAVTDKSNGLSAQDVLTVTSGPATSLVIKFGTPQ